MKRKMKSMLAVFVAIAFVMTTTPLSGFAAQTDVTLKNGALYNTDSTPFEGTLSQGDKITGSDPDSLFYVTVNGAKDTEESNYSSESFDGYVENGTQSELSTNKYYSSYTVPSAPEGYEVTASVSVHKSDDFTGTDASAKGNVVELTFTPVEAAEYTVTYYSNGKPYGEAQTYKAGETIVTPPAPEAPEGYVFNGWVINEEQDSLPETMPEKNLEASASWKLVDVTVTFISDGEEYHKSTAPFGSSMENTIPSDPEKESYVFAGWFDADGKNAYDFGTVASENMTFTAKWLRNCNVTYMISKDKSYAAYEVKEGDKIPVPEKNPEKFGHIFKGWSPEIPAVMPAEDLVFTAEFEIDKNFATVVIGGTVIAGTVIAGIGAALTGISIVGGIIAIIGLSSVIGNVEKTYTVTYKSDGKVYKTYEIESGKKITVPEAPSKEGYAFAGWSPEIPDKMPKKNLTFEATWTELDPDIPSTGSAGMGIVSLALFAVSAAAVIILAKKRKENQ